MPAPALLALIPGVLDLLKSGIDKVVPDKDLAEKLKHQLSTSLIPYLSQELQSKSNIIIAEAKSESWIARNWRPITMLTFVGLIVAKWFGFTVPGIDADLELALMELIKVGLGGYVVGRSGEKIAKAWKNKD